MKGPWKNKGGFSLVEVLVSIALLGLAVAPICSSLVLSHRVNGKSDALLQARLQVTSVVEELQARGIHPDGFADDIYDPNPEPAPESEPIVEPGTLVGIYKDVRLSVIIPEGEVPGYYTLTVTDTDEQVSITTVVKEAAP